jgi:hypothetical protein
MATRLIRVLACDGHGCTVRFSTGRGLTALTVLEHQARAAGWREKDGLHYCPQHQPWPGIAAWATAKAAL